MIELKHFLKKFVDLRFRLLELTELLIQVVYVPHSIFIKLSSVFVLTVLADHWNVKLFVSEHLDDLLHFVKCTRSMDHLTVLVINVR